MLGLLSAGVGIASGIKGLFAKKPKERTPRDGILSQAQGAREAADKYGFNPLTLLQAGAGHGFSQAPASTPPLASVAAIQDGLRGVDDILSGDQARRRQADQAELDLAKIRVDEAKRGVGLGQPRFTSGGSFTGNRAVTVAQPTIRKADPPMGRGQGKQLDSLRDVDVADTPNIPGFYQVENDWTGGPIYLPGESLEGDIDNLAIGAIVGIPQIAGRAARRAIFGDTVPLDWMREKYHEWTSDDDDDKPATRRRRRVGKYD